MRLRRSGAVMLFCGENQLKLFHPFPTQISLFEICISLLFLEEVKVIFWTKPQFHLYFLLSNLHNS